VRKADNLPPSCVVVTKSGSLNFLEPSGPVQASNGTAFTLHATIQRFQSPASDGAANKLATSVVRRSENDGQSATASFDTADMN